MAFNVALIGYGYWGKNLLRNLRESNHVSEITVVDINNDHLQQAQKIYPDVHICNEVKNVLQNKNIEVAIIATPTSTHYSIAKQFLEHHKHTLVEKPLCTQAQQAAELYQLATKNNCVLFTDLTFLYNGAVKYIKDFVTQNNIGPIRYIDATRVNLGIYQADTNVIWDLAIHDISIIQKLIQKAPTHVRAISHHDKSIKDIDLAYLFLYYPDDILVQINCSWASPAKIRKMTIGGTEKMIIYDEVEPTQKIKIYDYESSIQQGSINSTLIDYRLGDITIPKFSTEEPLKVMLQSFFDCIQSPNTSILSEQESIEIIQTLENAEKSLLLHGEMISM